MPAGLIERPVNHCRANGDKFRGESWKHRVRFDDEKMACTTLVTGLARGFQRFAGWISRSYIDLRELRVSDKMSGGNLGNLRDIFLVILQISLNVLRSNASRFIN